MKRLVFSLTAAGAFLGLTALASPARADVPPPNSCSASQVGQACNNANGDSGAGICTQSTCHRVNPTVDGGTISYTCYLCEASSGTGGSAGSGAGGSAGATSTGGSAGATSTGGTSSKSSSSSSSGCSLAAPEQDGALGGLMLVVGLGALAFGRRRRR